MKGTEVSAKLLLLLNADILEILATEDDDTTLGYMESQLIFLGIVELGELKAADLGSNDRRQPFGLNFRVAFGQEVLLVLVGSETPVGEFEGLQRLEGCLLVIDGEVVGIFVLQSLVVVTAY